MERQGEKRSISQSQALSSTAYAILIDIEGTATPATFVKDKLLPYIKENVEHYLEQHWDTDECQEDIEALREQSIIDREDQIEGVVDIPSDDDDDEDDEDDEAMEKRMEQSRIAITKAVKENVHWLMATDRRVASLKQLHCHMWRDAYKAGKIQGIIYEDVVDALKRWKTQGRFLYTYASCSVEAQKLLFGYSTKGNLTHYLSGYFDTTTGQKKEKESYMKIAATLALYPSTILFLTSIPAAASAASQAGFQTSLVLREGDSPLTEAEKKTFTTVSSFNELFIEHGQFPLAKK